MATPFVTRPYPFLAVLHPFTTVLLHPENIAQQMGAKAHFDGYKQAVNPFGPARLTHDVLCRRAWNSGWMMAHWDHKEN